MKFSKANGAALAALCAAFVTLSACRDGYSTQEANDICKEERERSPELTDEQYQDCILCYELCATCSRQPTTPATYACPEEK